MAVQQQVPAEQQQQQQRHVVQLKAVDITEENFKPFGQVRLLPQVFAAQPLVCRRRHAGAYHPPPAHLLQLIGPTDDGKEFDGEDAQLELDQGQPR